MYSVCENTWTPSMIRLTIVHLQDALVPFYCLCLFLFLNRAGRWYVTCSRERASGQGTSYVIYFIYSLLWPDVQSQDLLCKLDPTGFLCMHYLDKYLSACELWRPGLSIHRGQNSVCCPWRRSVFLTPRAQMPYLLEHQQEGWRTMKRTGTKISSILNENDRGECHIIRNSLVGH